MCGMIYWALNIKNLCGNLLFDGIKHEFYTLSLPNLKSHYIMEGATYAALCETNSSTRRMKWYGPC